MVLLIALALARSSVAQTATAKIILQRCTANADASLPFLKAEAVIADNTRNNIVDRTDALQTIVDLLKLSQSVCEAKTLPDSNKAWDALGKWIQQQKPRINVLPTIKAAQ